MLHHQDERVTLHHGDCIDVMRELPDASVDSIVTDPPYGLGFMGKGWDALPPGEEWARECLRVLKPGGHLLAFGGTRTWHRLAVSVEDAGFEIRDSIAWLYGSGFPKSLDVSKAIDAKILTGKTNSAGIKAANDARPVDESRPSISVSDSYMGRKTAIAAGYKTEAYQARETYSPTTAATPEAAQWSGWGTALKPAFEPIVFARKPLSGTVAATVLEHGTGALNIDACRIHANDAPEGRVRHGGGIPGNGSSYELPDVRPSSPAGRWPANVVLDDTTAPILDQQSGTLKSGANPTRRNAPKFGNAYGEFDGVTETPARGADSGGASRFFYVAKAPKRERPNVDGVQHPTVKPLALMRWLVRLITPPGGVVLEPFAGSGTTVEAALLEGFDCIAIEREAEYLPLILSRLPEVEEDVEPTLDFSA